MGYCSDTKKSYGGGKLISDDEIIMNNGIINVKKRAWKMEYEKIVKDSMKEKYARQIVEWKYEGNYAEYNLPSYDECVEKKYGITREEKKDNYIVYVLDGEVIFYSNMKQMDDKKIYIGVGLKPEYCGKGIGNYFLVDSVEAIKSKYPGSKLFLEVRSWNIRAIKSYEKLGFKITQNVISKDRFGNDTEFTEMEYN